jgi:hypothetical protein
LRCVPRTPLRGSLAAASAKSAAMATELKAFMGFLVDKQKSVETDD